MSLNAWNKRVHCIHSWAVYAFSIDVLAELLDSEIVAIPVLYGAPLRVTDLKSLMQDPSDSNAQNDSLYLVDNTLSSCALCDPGLFGADIVLEKINIDTIDRPIWIAGIPKNSRVTHEQIDILNRHFAPHQLDLSDYEFRDAISRFEKKVKADSDLAKITYEYLSCHPSIGYVSYLGSKDHVDYSVSTKTLRGGFSGYIDFMLRDTAPKSILSFLDQISMDGMDVEFLSVDQEYAGVDTIIRLKCTSNSALSFIQGLEKALAPYKRCS